MNILFVCTGNTCRSPIAEGYLKSLNLKDTFVKSCGLCADGSPVSTNSNLVMEEIGIDISSHLSKQITKVDITWADKIICMSNSHITALQNICKNKLSLLGTGICDPFGCDTQTYRNCRNQIIKEIELLFKGYCVVPLEEKYVSQIAELEKICFSSPWSAEAILDSFKMGTKFFVATDNEKCLGYAGLSAILDEGYITNVAVFPEHRKKGIAASIMESVFRFAKENKLSFVSLEVRPSNTAAVSLYEKFGFKIEGRRKNFYTAPNEDALIMTKRFD